MSIDKEIAQDILKLIEDIKEKIKYEHDGSLSFKGESYFLGIEIKSASIYN